MKFVKWSILLLSILFIIIYGLGIFPRYFVKKDIPYLTDFVFHTIDSSVLTAKKILRGPYIKGTKHTVLFHTMPKTWPDKKKELKITLSTDEDKGYTIDENGNTILIGGGTDILYYNQSDPRWANKYYGTDDTISIYGCGPTALAMIVSSMTDTIYTPEQMAQWAYQHHFYSENSGSYHTIIPNGCESFGLSVTSITNYTPEAIMQELYAGKVIVMLMDKGHFTDGGHFIILRGVTLSGKILIADPKSLENSLIPWDIQILLEEAKYSAYAGGPVWSIGTQKNASGA